MINVVFASDENYVPYLSVAIISFLKNNEKSFDYINMFILDSDIKKDSKNKLQDLVKSFNVNLTFINSNNLINFEGIKSMDKNDVISFAAYSRLFLSSLIPKEINKILYLDCDSLILGSFEELWDKNIENYYCGAVLDQYNGTTITKKIIGLNDFDNYFNSGVLLINLEKWREENIESKFLDFLFTNKNNIFLHDQDVINSVLKDKILVLDPKFNLMSPFHDLNYNTVIKWEGLYNKYYDEKCIESALNSPVFIHFTGGNVTRPWVNNNGKFRKIYEKYANLTPFENEIFAYDKKLTHKELFRFNLYKSILVTLFLNLIPHKYCIKFANKRRDKLYKTNLLVFKK